MDPQAPFRPHSHVRVGLLALQAFLGEKPSSLQPRRIAGSHIGVGIKLVYTCWHYMYIYIYVILYYLLYIDILYIYLYYCIFYTLYVIAHLLSYVICIFVFLHIIYYVFSLRIQVCPKTGISPNQSYFGDGD